MSSIEPSFLDTNVLVYAYSGTEPDKCMKARTLLHESSLCISTQVINEFIWVMTRKYKVAPTQLQQIINALYDLYQVETVARKQINQALSLSASHGFSHWDALIIASALQAECGILYSEDLQNGRVVDNSLRIVNPFA
jgi:predicted nucleic acid-binding protein